MEYLITERIVTPSYYEGDKLIVTGEPRVKQFIQYFGGEFDGQTECYMNEGLKLTEIRAGYSKHKDSLFRIVSLNSMTGFEVDAQREEFLTTYINSLNSVSVESSSRMRVANNVEETAREVIVESDKLVENKLSFWQRFLKLFK